jgi:hypothetical protein
MTSRRSMLKGIAAAFLGGCWGLGREVMALPSCASAATPSSSAGPKTSSVAHSGAMITRTFYDSEGRVIAIHHECPN